MSATHPLAKFSIPIASAFLMALAAMALGSSPSPVSRGPKARLVAEREDQSPRNASQVIPGQFRNDTAETGPACALPESEKTAGVSGNAHLKTVRFVSRDEEGRLVEEWEELANGQANEFVGRVAAISLDNAGNPSTVFLVDFVSGFPPDAGTEISVPGENGSVRYQIKVARVYQSNEGKVEQLGCLCTAPAGDPLVKGFEFKICFNRRVRHGVQRSFYANGQILMEGYFNEGLRCGNWRQYNEDGSRAWSARYENDRLNGEWMTWHGNGIMWRRGSYRDDNKDGVWNEWNGAGVLVETMEWNAGQKHGSYSAWFDDGQVRQRGEFRNGRAEGHWTIWRQDGTLMLEGDYLNDDQVGEWTDTRTDEERSPSLHLLPGSGRDPDEP